MEHQIKQERYDSAVKRVKKIKGFYTHALVYVVINIGIVIININNLNPGESYFKLENFFTFFFLGLGLLAHGLCVFLPNFIFGQNWEERKIKQLMEQEKKKNWQ